MKLKPIMQNKKGGFGILLFFIVLFTIIIIGFFATILWSVVDIASDEITPIMEDLGVVEGTNTNLSEYGEYAFGTADTVVQALPWIIAISYIMALIFSLAFIFLIGYNPHPAFIGFYLVFMILIIMGCILISNMYEDIYTGTDDLALRLQEQEVMSWMILQSPLVMAIIGIIGGILMFARQASAEAGQYGGLGV